MIDMIIEEIINDLKQPIFPDDYIFTVDANSWLSWGTWIGIFACVISGMMRAWGKKYNFVGALTLSIAAACGGGITRDILGNKVPSFIKEAPWFRRILLAVLILTVLKIIFNLKIIRKFIKNLMSKPCNQELQEIIPPLRETTIEVCDALGLGCFTIIGVEFALSQDFVLSNSNLYKVSFLQDYHIMLLSLLFAVLTACGGGIIRDILALQTPYAFAISSMYAFFPVIGGMLYYLLRTSSLRYATKVGKWDIIVSVFVVMLLRLGYWFFREYQREQYVSLVLLRNSEGHYLMEAGMSGSLSVIGGKFDIKDGKEGGWDAFKATAIREVKEELGLWLEVNNLIPLDFSKKEESKGEMDYTPLEFRARSLRTGQMVKYHIAVFDYPTLNDKQMVSIVKFRKSRNRCFELVDVSEIEPLSKTIIKKVLKFDQIGKFRTFNVSYGLFKRIKENLNSSTNKHENGDFIFAKLLDESAPSHK